MGSAGAGAGEEDTSQMEGEEDNNYDDSAQYIYNFGDGHGFGSPPRPAPPPGEMEESSSVVKPGGSSSNSLDSLQYLLAEATRFSTEIKRLTGEVNVANQRIQEQDSELVQCKNQISEQSQLIEEQQKRIDVLESEKQNFGGGGEGGGEDASDLDIKELKCMVAKEREGRVQAEEKLEKLKKSMKSVVCEEFDGFLQDLKKHFGGDLNSDDLGGNGGKAQDRLDRLSKFVEEKFGTWAENQSSLKADLRKMSKLVLNLSTIVNSTSKTPNVESTAPPPPPPSRRSVKATSATRSDILQQKQEGPAMPVSINQNEMSNRKRSRSTPPRGVPSISSRPPKRFGSTAASPANADLEHGEDLSKMNRGFFCICGTEYSTRPNLKIHVQTNTEVGKFKCDICNQPFVHYYCMLKRHLKDKHNIAPEKGKVGCASCGEVFSSFVELHEHRKIAQCTHVPVMNQNASSDFNSENSCEDENDDIDDCEFIDPDHANPVPNNNPRDPPIKKADFFAARRNSSQTLSESEASGEDDDYENNERRQDSGKKHGMNIGRRHEGFYCVCGDKFVTRELLDGHLQFESKKMGVERKSLVEEDDEGDEEYVAEALEEEEEEGAGPEGGNDCNPIQEHRVHPTNELSCICGFKTTIKYNLTKHVKYNNMERKFSCQKCPLTFANLSYLRRHYLRTHKDIAMYNEIKSKSGCSKCGKTFRSMLELQRHRRIAHGVKTPFPNTKSFQRSMGGRPAFIRNPKGQFAGTRRSFQVQSQDQDCMGNYRGQRTEKRRLVSSRKFQCSVCLARYPTFHQLSRHKRAKHNIIQRGFAIGCVDCGITFSTRTEHTRHRITVHQSAIGRKRLVKSENGSVICSCCGFTFQSWILLLQHKRTAHRGKGKDDVRGEGASSPSPRKSTPAKARRTYHKRPQTPQVKDAPRVTHGVDVAKASQGHYCLCGKNCNSERALILHIRYHKRERNLPCNYCDRRFICPSYLKQHTERSHKNVVGVASSKLNRCGKCGKTFRTNVELYRHNKTAHKSTKITYGTRNPRKATYQTITATDEIGDGDIHEVANLGTVSKTPTCWCRMEYLLE